jgi:NAD(P)-dependent dehydrogenase (short-subunit alcohol dehydrogenase family)
MPPETLDSLFSGHTVVLTGVGREGQLGEIVARQFAGHGANVVVVDRRRETVDARIAALAQNGGTATGYACDLTDADAVARLANEVRRAHGSKLHALVHMAGGFAMSGPVANSSLDVWDRMLATHLRATYLTTRAFLPLLRAGRGSIVLFSSQAALSGATGADMSAYAVAKTGVAVLTRAIAAEERENGVRANAVAPSVIRTAANVQAMGENASYVEREDVASTVTFLCSGAAAAITGQVIALA